mmetsp:Transcript_79054/g.256387  ORF Transcript_79054/g.256387 Transcript_79054/m.256387 type:complete len:140 (+) Transcript_79054:59-478(+)
MAPKSIALGTDCSGMETPVMALKNLGVEVNHVFACDVNAHAKKTIMANFPPNQWYDDLTKRDNATAPQDRLVRRRLPLPALQLGRQAAGFRRREGQGHGLLERPRLYRLQAAQGLHFGECGWAYHHPGRPVLQGHQAEP